MYGQLNGKRHGEVFAKHPETVDRLPVLYGCFPKPTDWRWGIKYIALPSRVQPQRRSSTEFASTVTHNAHDPRRRANCHGGRNTAVSEAGSGIEARQSAKSEGSYTYYRKAQPNQPALARPQGPQGVSSTSQGRETLAEHCSIVPQTGLAQRPRAELPTSAEPHPLDARDFNPAASRSVIRQ
ncbi:hypothetical protein C8Q74DRAFT_607605 [Fomes fomentarius]|nr:hypothetical protein C8Q74DRAFT_607605 [Fomes fomentarius]